MSTIGAEEIELDRVCVACRGQGTWITEDTGVSRACSVCNGAGACPTEFGRALLDSFKRNFNDLLQVALAD
jgi:DnaJ-class molecular chaperone